jgi:hypothetical protein
LAAVWPPEPEPHQNVYPEPEPHQNVYPEPEPHKNDAAPQHWFYVWILHSYQAALDISTQLKEIQSP